jgi:dCTP diphosphatase
MQELIKTINEFVRERDWEQFHSPKNLSMALSVEASEIAEHFLWLTQEESRNLPKEKIDAVKDEIGDVLTYLLRLCEVLKIDPIEAANDKMVKNKQKYPKEVVKGQMKKYNEY